jgi:hypothetical protein
MLLEKRRGIVCWMDLGRGRLRIWSGGIRFSGGGFKI